MAVPLLSGPYSERQRHYLMRSRRMSVDFRTPDELYLLVVQKLGVSLERPVGLPVCHSRDEDKLRQVLTSRVHHEVHSRRRPSRGGSCDEKPGPV